MFCRNCAAANQDGSSRCYHCGARTGSRPLFISCVVLIVLIGAVIGGYYWYETTTPKYSLLQAKRAFEQHDSAMFQKYVDVDGIINSGIDQILAYAQTKVSPDDEWQRRGLNIGKGLVEFLKPQFGAIARREVAKLIEHGSLDEDGDSNSLFLAVSSILREKSGPEFVGLTDLRTEGKIGFIALRIRPANSDENVKVDLKLRQQDGYWQVSEILNIAELLQKLEAREAKLLKSKADFRPSPVAPADDTEVTEPPILDAQVILDERVAGAFVAANFTAEQVRQMAIESLRQHEIRRSTEGRVDENAHDWLSIVIRPDKESGIEMDFSVLNGTYYYNQITRWNSKRKVREMTSAAFQLEVESLISELASATESASYRTPSRAIQ